MIERLLQNYRLLVHKVDLFRLQAESKYASHLACKPGCDGCCRHLTLFPVEALAIASALRMLPAEQAAALRKQARAANMEGACPLLLDGLCGLYDSRPLICRTHGLPVVTAHEGVRQVDCCPLNFQGVESLPGDSVLDLQRLNETLVAVNALFIEQCADGLSLSNRMSVAEALLLPLPLPLP